MSFDVHSAAPRRREAWNVAVSTAVVLILTCLAIGLRAHVSVRGRDETFDPDAPQAQVVLAYLNALASADAATALELSATQPSDTRLLTHEVLAESQSRLPISDISVTAVTVHGSRTSVDASYRLGQLSVSQQLPLVQSNDTWRLERGYAVVDVSTIAPVPVKIDERLVGGRAMVFPGSHRVSTGLPWLGFGEQALWLVTSVDDVDPLATPLRVALTASGRAAFRGAAEQALARCTSIPAIVPPACPWAAGLAESARVQRSSIVWKLDQRSVRALEPVMVAGPHARVAHAGAVLELTLSAVRVERGRPQRYVEWVVCYVTVTVDMLAIPLTAKLL